MNKTDKSQLRKNILHIRNNLEASFVEEASKKIAERLKSTKILDFYSVLAYSDFKNEVKTSIIINYLINNGRAVYLPRCNIADKSFKPVRINDNEMKLNDYGIYEPIESRCEISANIECAIVPGVAFDILGNRIGFGVGYYDKFFQNNQSVYKIGLCYEFQLCDKIQSFDHDVPMDVVITENRTIYFK